MKPNSKEKTKSNHTSICQSGAKDHTCWIPLDKYKDYNAFPKFFGEKLINVEKNKNIEHIVTEAY